MILWNDEQVAQDLLDALSGSAEDIDVVFSYPEGNTSPNRVSVDAYRVAGADGAALRDGFIENYTTSTSSPRPWRSRTRPSVASR